MAITRMTSADRANLPNVRTVTDYPGHEAGRVSHGSECPHASKWDMSGALSPECPTTSYGYRPCHVLGALYMETTHAGLVLRIWERNGYDDSDFYAEVWNPETGRPETIEYASTRGWCYPNGAAVDATPEVRAAYEAWYAAEEAKRTAARLAAEAARPAFGKRVRVVKGRKVAKGTEGEVCWEGLDAYRGQPRIGIRLADGSKVYTAAANVVVVREGVPA